MNNKFKYSGDNRIIMVKKDSYSCDYSEVSDILSIHKNDVKTKESAELGNFIVDFDSKDNIVGVSIENASEFFKGMDRTIDDLKSIERAIIRVDTRDPNLFVVWMLIKFPNGEEKIPFPAPIAMEH